MNAFIRSSHRPPFGDERVHPQAATDPPSGMNAFILDTPWHRVDADFAPRAPPSRLARWPSAGSGRRAGCRSCCSRRTTWSRGSWTRLPAGSGFSQVAVDGCEADELGRPLLIDCRQGSGSRGCSRRSTGSDRGCGCGCRWCEGRELYGCVRGRVGQPYDALGLVVPKTGPVGGWCARSSSTSACQQPYRSRFRCGRNGGQWRRTISQVVSGRGHGNPWWRSAP
jgi:hypothetical protein